MAIPKAIREAAGAWQGANRLHLAFMPEGERIFTCDTRLWVDLDPHGTYATLRYVWSHDDEEHIGTMILCGRESTGKVTAGWADSWHQSTAVMALEGTGMEGKIDLYGEFEVRDSPPWGWRITFELEAERLTMMMYLIDPSDRSEEWGVEAIYMRAPAE